MSNDNYTPREDRDSVLSTLSEYKEYLTKRLHFDSENSGEYNYKTIVSRDALNECKESIEIVMKVYGIGNKKG